MNVALTIVFFGLLVFLAHLFSSIYTKRKIPDVLLLLGIGILIGPILNLVDTSTFGMGGPVFVSVTLVIILFESGTSLSFDVLRSSWRSTITLSIVGFLMAMFLVTGVCLLYGFGFMSSLTLGAILGGTSSAVVIPLVKNLQIGEKTRTVLILESASTDVLCIVFALAFLQAIKLGQLHIGSIIGDILSSFILAGVIGFAGAMLWSRLITKMRKLQNSIFTTPAFVFIIYGIAEILGYSGAIAALTFGISMANIETIKNRFLLKIMGGRGHKLDHTEQIFFGEIVFLLKTVFFVYIGISMEFNDMTSIFAGLAITIMLFLGRILISRYIYPTAATTFDKTIISMMIPKGLAAAVLANIPLSMGIEGGEFIKNTTYAVILFSITFVSVMILLVDKLPIVRKFYVWLYWKKGKDTEDKPYDIKTIFLKLNEMEDESYTAFNSSPGAVLEKYRSMRKHMKETLSDQKEPNDSSISTEPTEPTEPTDPTTQVELQKQKGGEQKTQKTQKPQEPQERQEEYAEDTTVFRKLGKEE